MSEKVEQVAHAIEQAMVNYRPDKAQCSRDMGRVLARAAIEAVREPTEAMQNAFIQQGYKQKNFALEWAAAIDEALK